MSFEEMSLEQVLQLGFEFPFFDLLLPILLQLHPTHKIRYKRNAKVLTGWRLSCHA